MRVRWVRMGLAGVLVAAGMLGAAELSAQEKTVGLSLPESKNPFYVAMEKAIVARLQERGVRVKSVIADGDINRQVNGINDLIAARVNALLVSPADLRGPAPAIKAANEAGIPVFLVARKLAPEFDNLWKAFVGVDLQHAGRIKGEWVVNNLPGGKVAMLLGPPGAFVTLEQSTGFKQAIEKAGKTAQFPIVFQQASQQTREIGLKLAEDILTAHPDIRVIYAGNDDLALGAVQAVKAAGKLPQVKVLGLNASPPAAASVAKGEMAMTVALSPTKWGQSAADLAADYVLTGKLPATKETIYGDPELVDQKNAINFVPPALRKDFGL